jgi:hypothetical protein
MTQPTAEDLLRRALSLLSTHSPDNDNKLICDILNHLQKIPPCSECGATTPQEAKARCIRTSAKGVCHGCELWPDEIAFDAPRPLTVEGVQRLADDLAAVIRQVDGNHSLGAAALAEEILRHWQPPQAPKAPEPAIELLKRALNRLPYHSDSDRALFDEIWLYLRQFPPCQECGARTLEEAKTLCNSDFCHGCELWHGYDSNSMQPAAQPAPTTERTAIISRLRKLSHAITEGREARDREFTRRIPAEPLRDADIVLWTAAQMLEADQSEPVKLTDEELLRTYGLAKRDYCYEGPSDDWPKRAERAATICGLRAVLARCCHSAEPVAPPPPPSTEKLFTELDQLLYGIDRHSDHPEGGWWETEDGAKFGRIKLRELKELITRHLSPPQP